MMPIVNVNVDAVVLRELRLDSRRHQLVRPARAARATVPGFITPGREGDGWSRDATEAELDAAAGEPPGYGLRHASAEGVDDAQPSTARHEDTTGETLPAAPAVSHEQALEDAYEAGYDAAYQAAYEAIYNEAHQSGCAEGKEAGLQAGLEAAREMAEQAGSEALEQLVETSSTQLAERLQDADRLLDSLRQSIALRLDAVEGDLVEVVYAAVCRIVGTAALQPAGVAAVIDQALAQLQVRNVQAIRVSVHDYAWMQIEPQWAERVLGGRAGQVAWLADETVARGGCIIVGNAGSLDARLEVQLQQLRELLLERSPAQTQQLPAAAGAMAVQ